MSTDEVPYKDYPDCNILTQRISIQSDDIDILFDLVAYRGQKGKLLVAVSRLGNQTAAIINIVDLADKVIELVDKEIAKRSPIDWDKDGEVNSTQRKSGRFARRKKPDGSRKKDN